MLNEGERIPTTPIQAELSVRPDVVRAITSGQPGKMIPLAFAPVLREDRVNANFNVQVDMMETAERLLNGINVTVMAHFIPFLAFDRFEGSMDLLNRSYKKEVAHEGGTVTPFFHPLTYNSAGSNEIMDTLGCHIPNGALYNSAAIEAYNILWNFRAKSRSTKLTERDVYDLTLAPAFWKNGSFKEIVPDFDSALIDGEVAVDLATNLLPVRGLGLKSGESYNYATRDLLDTTGTRNVRTTSYTSASATPMIEVNGSDIPQVFAELQGSGVTLSLSNIEMAKKTAAFANLRKKYAGHDDDYIIDLLMDAIRVPDQALNQPILLDRASTLMGYSTRYATDAGNLAKSATQGQTRLNLRMRTPHMNTGGVLLITAEVVPEQMFERQYDHFLLDTDQDKLPFYVRDYLDPEKVDVVPNKRVDVEHTNPDGVFGYAPLNSHWRRNFMRAGGKYKRVIGDPFSEDRQRIWTVESADPGLTSDFYVVNSIHNKVFADTVSDPFEFVTIGKAQIAGNTVFGKGLQEDTGDYDKVDAQVDKTRIVQA